MTLLKKRLIACPGCNKLSEFSSSNAFRPFCCERCKLIDLGLWASEEYTIPQAIKIDALSEEELIDQFNNLPDNSLGN